MQNRLFYYEDLTIITNRILYMCAILFILWYLLNSVYCAVYNILYTTKKKFENVAETNKLYTSSDRFYCFSSKTNSGYSIRCIR